MENNRLQHKAENVSSIIDELIQEIENLEGLTEKQQDIIGMQEEEIEQLKSRINQSK